MEHSAEFRRCLEECDVPAARKLWHHIAPHLPQPANDLEAMATIHRARTEMPSMHIRLRAYSHRWLIDNGYPSALPDDLKPKAERMYPRIVEGVGIAAKAASELMRPAIPIIRLAMSDAVSEAYAERRTDPVYVKARILEARRLCIKKLFAFTVSAITVIVGVAGAAHSRPLSISASPSAPNIGCALAPGSTVATVSTLGGNGRPITLTMTGDTLDFMLSGIRPPADVVVVPRGVVSADCGMVESVAVTATQ